MWVGRGEGGELLFFWGGVVVFVFFFFFFFFFLLLLLFLLVCLFVFPIFFNPSNQTQRNSKESFCHTSLKKKQKKKYKIRLRRFFKIIPISKKKQQTDSRYRRRIRRRAKEQKVHGAQKLHSFLLSVGCWNNCIFLFFGFSFFSVLSVRSWEGKGRMGGWGDGGQDKKCEAFFSSSSSSSSSYFFRVLPFVLRPFLLLPPLPCTPSSLPYPCPFSPPPPPPPRTQAGTHSDTHTHPRDGKVCFFARAAGAAGSGREGRGGREAWVWASRVGEGVGGWWGGSRARGKNTRRSMK